MRKRLVAPFTRAREFLAEMRRGHMARQREFLASARIHTDNPDLQPISDQPPTYRLEGAVAPLVFTDPSLPGRPIIQPPELIRRPLLVYRLALPPPLPPPTGHPVQYHIRHIIIHHLRREVDLQIRLPLRVDFEVVLQPLGGLELPAVTFAVRALRGMCLAHVRLER